MSWLSRYRRFIANRLQMRLTTTQNTLIKTNVIVLIALFVSCVTIPRWSVRDFSNGRVVILDCRSCSSADLDFYYYKDSSIALYCNYFFLDSLTSDNISRKIFIVFDGDSMYVEIKGADGECKPNNWTVLKDTIYLEARFFHGCYLTGIRLLLIPQQGTIVAKEVK